MFVVVVVLFVVVLRVLADVCRLIMGSRVESCEDVRFSNKVTGEVARVGVTRWFVMLRLRRVATMSIMNFVEDDRGSRSRMCI